jgi:hypothetical protein
MFGVSLLSASDMQVFCLHTRLAEDCDPTNSDEWRFFVLPTSQLLGRRSIRLTILRSVADEIACRTC